MTLRDLTGGMQMVEGVRDSVVDLTVVIPHYGDAGPTQAVVDLVERQTGQLSTECIVVDDCSPEAFPGGGSAVVVRRETNGGFGSAVNSGAAIARGRLLLILNSDVSFEQDFVPSLIEGSRPWMPAVVSPWVVSDEGLYQWVGRRYPTILQQSVEWLTPLARWRGTSLMHRVMGHEVSVRAGEDSVVDWVVGACMLLPLSVFRNAGGFDERFFMNSEEVDLQRRLHAEGIPSVIVGGVELRHAGGGSSDPLRRRQWLVNARFRYAAKWGGRQRLAVALVVASCVNFGFNALRQMRGADVRTVDRLLEELSLVREGLRS